MAKCEKCGKEFKTEGGLRLHAPYCKGSEGEKCPECGGVMRLLNPNEPMEKMAINAGYAGICDKCREVV